MPLFPSPEWMDEFSAAVLAHEGSDEVAQVLDGVYRFVVDPEGPLREQHTYDVEIRHGGADGASAGRLEELADDPRVTLMAGYERWRQLITGQLDIKMAILMRRLRVKGDVRPLIGGLSSAKPLVEALHAVETQWR